MKEITMDQNLLLKIKKLMALADDKASKEESAIAFGKAQALMLKHKIDVAMLNSVEEEDKEEAEIFKNSPLNEEDLGKKSLATWKKMLARVLCEFNGCFTYTHGTHIILVGKPSDVATVRYLYSYCTRQIDKLTRKHCRGQGRTYSNNFRLGCVSAIKQSMKDERDAMLAELQATCDERSLLVVDNTLLQLQKDRQEADSLARSKTRLRRSSSSFRGNDAAKAAGKAAGSSIYNGRGTSKLSTPQKKLG
jgi:hypothetical protein